ncbi:MAG: ribonuclease III [bacterium]|jgi:ribonuclease-3
MTVINSESLDRLLDRLRDWGIKVTPELAKLVATALTHSSYAYENNTQPNERLEFLGDAVLELVVSQRLFNIYPDKSEGELTRYRAQLVCEPTLARCAQELRLGSALRLGRGEEAQGGRYRPALLADAVEALLGAVYLTGGLAAAELVVERLLDPYFSGQFKTGFDFKTALQERLQANGQTDIKYAILQTEGPAHARRFTIGLMVDGTLCTTGVGNSKKEAEQEAAGKLLRQLSN